MRALLIVVSFLYGVHAASAAPRDCDAYKGLFPSCAVGLASSVGSLVGSAKACQVDTSVTDQMVFKMLGLVGLLKQNDADFHRAVDSFSLFAKTAFARQLNPATAQSCSVVMDQAVVFLKYPPPSN